MIIAIITLSLTAKLILKAFFFIFYIIFLFHSSQIQQNYNTK